MILPCVGHNQRLPGLSVVAGAVEVTGGVLTTGAVSPATGTAMLVADAADGGFVGATATALELLVAGKLVELLARFGTFVFATFVGSVVLGVTTGGAAAEVGSEVVDVAGVTTAGVTGGKLSELDSTVFGTAGVVLVDGTGSTTVIKPCCDDELDVEVAGDVDGTLSVIDDAGAVLGTPTAVAADVAGVEVDTVDIAGAGAGVLTAAGRSLADRSLDCGRNRSCWPG